MPKRMNVRRLLRKHESECQQRLEGIGMYEERPYDHDTEQIIKACEDDIRMIWKLFFTLDGSYEKILEQKDEKIMELMERIEELTHAPIIES